MGLGPRRQSRYVLMNAFDIIIIEATITRRQWIGIHHLFIPCPLGLIISKYVFWSFSWTGMKPMRFDYGAPDADK